MPQVDNYDRFESRIVPSKEPTPPRAERPDGVLPKQPPLTSPQLLNSVGRLPQPETLDALRKRSGG